MMIIMADAGGALEMVGQSTGPMAVDSDVDRLMNIADPALYATISRPFLERHSAVPVGIREGRLILATTDAHLEVPELAAAFGAREIQRVTLKPSELDRLRTMLDLGILREHRPVAGTVGAASSPAYFDAETVRIFQTILSEAVERRASDIHVERYRDQVRLRVRVDGDLHDLLLHLSPKQMLGIVNVVKVRAKLDISERRLPQGGRFTQWIDETLLDLRVQTQPSLYGEHLVVRLLPHGVKALTIEQLGFPEDLAATFRRLLESPSGLLLVAAPTGAGKTTTLYAGLQLLARDPTRKVVTIEDPIEYAIDGVQQTQVQTEIGFHFASATRSFVRQDPDVIFVGEIRDGETALEAIRASQTGHVVLSTIHCNDSVSAIQRLIDLGMDANSVTNEFLGVFAQRLVRRICRDCRKEARPRTQLVEEIFPDGLPAGFRCYEGAGCGSCDNSGTKGRIAIVEYLPAHPAFRRAVAHRKPIDELRLVASQIGIARMRDHALDLVGKGVIALDELPLVLAPEQLRPLPGQGEHS